MATESHPRSSRIAALIVLFTAWSLAAVTPASAAKNVTELEGVAYNVHASLGDNLTSLLGKRVRITLDSGDTIAGTVKAVGEHLVHLEKLEGRDFFDGLVRMDAIRAVDTRFRDFQK